jgi:hypothetical protein
MRAFADFFWRHKEHFYSIWGIFKQIMLDQFLSLIILFSGQRFGADLQHFHLLNLVINQGFKRHYHQRKTVE